MSIIQNILKSIFGDKSSKDIKKMMPTVEKIKEEYAKLADISNDELRALTASLRQQLKDSIKEEEEQLQGFKDKLNGHDPLSIKEQEQLYNDIDKSEKNIQEILKGQLDEMLPQAFAIIKETAHRFAENEQIVVTATDLDREFATRFNNITIDGDKAIYANTWMAGGNMLKWNMVHYDVQLIGGIALHQGRIAEMATGEGKTLVATLPVFLNALTGRGVHVVTVNDYLAKRDSEWMGMLYMFQGLTVDCIDKHQPNSAARRKAYYSDITFGTNNEFGFDYLRDNMCSTPEELVQRKHVYAIVDEVDSVLIDDARTPLIISGPVPNAGDDIQMFLELKPKVVKLVEEQKQLVNRLLIDAKNYIKAGDKDKGGIALLKAWKGLPKNNALIKFLSQEGNKVLLQNTEAIYMAENNKRMPEITDELFFVIEEKQKSVDLTEKGIDLITGKTDDPQFFVLPDVGSEIAELEHSSLSEEEKMQRRDEIMSNFATKSERVHTINQLLKAYTMFERDVEYVVMDNKIKIVDEQTGRILDGRRYSDGLHQAIEAKESVKVEAATQTFATITLQNYFRMYEKIAGMTGTAETEAGEFWEIYKLDVCVIPTNRKVIRDDKEDLVYKTKREKYKAVIDEVQKLHDAGRPVLVGTTSVEISELLSQMLKMRKLDHNVLNAKQHAREAEIVAQAGQSGTITIATNMAGRGTDIKLSDEVKAAGGLAIIGTERHESRRVDRQLRGRAGRQGDPGSSQFFVSLEDNLMRLFGSDRIAALMDRMGIEEGEVIQHKIVTKSIERAQKKVEENNFGIRKRLLEYDDVMNKQREVIYRQRRNALYGDGLDIEINNMLNDACDNLVKYGRDDDFTSFSFEVAKSLGISCPVTEEDFLQLSDEAIGDKIFNAAFERMSEKMKLIREKAAPIIQNVYETQKDRFEYIIVPISDGRRVFQIRVNLQKAYESNCREITKAFQKIIMLVTIDENWKQHLRDLDDLKQSVQDARYEQKDPLVIFKIESNGLFGKMLDKNNKSVVSTLMRAQIPMPDPEQLAQAQAQAQAQARAREQAIRREQEKMKASQEQANSINDTPKQPQQQLTRREPVQRTQPVRAEKKPGRNDPCPCGSGKKYITCHVKDSLE
ncbi:MAG: preprotein translocase subunit SecA [Bacteroidales bacterium]|nr:preprotein translocase subunit SecA [Bacteroidales bacterium]